MLTNQQTHALTLVLGYTSGGLAFPNGKKLGPYNLGGLARCLSVIESCSPLPN